MTNVSCVHKILVQTDRWTRTGISPTESVSDCCATPSEQCFSYIMVASFSGGKSWSARREPPIMGK